MIHAKVVIGLQNLANSLGTAETASSPIAQRKIRQQPASNSCSLLAPCRSRLRVFGWLGSLKCHDASCLHGNRTRWHRQAASYVLHLSIKARINASPSPKRRATAIHKRKQLHPRPNFIKPDGVGNFRSIAWQRLV